MAAETPATSDARTVGRPARCLVVTSIASGGGVTESVFTAIDMLGRAGVETVAAVPSDFLFLDRMRATGIPVHAVPGLSAGGAAFIPLQAWRLARIARDAGADLVMVNNGRFVGALKRLLRIPVLTIYHGGKVERFMGADRIITINEPQRDLLIERGYPAERVTVVDNALPVEEMPPFRPRPATANPVVGTLRLLEPAKGVDTLIEAIALLAGRGRRLRTRIGSTGSQEAKLRALAKERGVADLIDFAGWIDDKDAFYASLDLYVLPSRAEEWGIGIVEAQAASLPVVSTACLGPLRIVKDGITGLLVPPEDPSAMADAIDRLVADPALAARLAEAGWRDCGENYILPRIAPKYAADVLETLRMPRR
ncbi:glycosyltransferase family 4 protein [Alsobacter sp. R-9]